MRLVRVALVQHDIVWEDRDATLNHLHPLIKRAASEGARLVVLTELFAVGFTMQTKKVAEPAEGPTTRWMRDQAAEHDIWLCGSVPEVNAGDDRPSNQLVLVAPDGATHRYAKVHRFASAGEDDHYAAGTGEITVDVDSLRVTPFVCYDLRFGDRFWARAADSDCYVVVASWPAARRTHWRALLVARAIENQAYVVGCNRVGIGGDVDYVGDSLVVDPFGEVLADGKRGLETVLVADIDPARVATIRAQYPFLRDR
jgi:predicted amidohydrolase